MNRKERAAGTEAALKAAAKRVFAARGYLNTKITDITAEAGRAAGSFYNHFAGKEELLKALLADMSADSDTMASETGHRTDFTDPEAVRWHVAAYVRFHRENAATLRALRQAAMVSEEFAGTLERFRATETADLLSHLAHITDAGLRLPASPRATLDLLTGLIASYVWVRAPKDADEEAETIEAVTRFAYRGLTGRDY